MTDALVTNRMESLAHELDFLAAEYNKLVGKHERSTFADLYIKEGASLLAEVVMEEILDEEFAPSNHTAGFIRTDGVVSRLTLRAIRIRRGEGF